MDPVVPNLSSLQSEEGAELLDAIDGLRSHGISRFVSLPQIIVVGDQSSGKSSVLEAITGVAFPTNDGLCTRFATEVILRRSRNEKASVRIRPHENCAPERRAELEAFRQANIALTQVSGLIAEATKAMGIAGHVSFSKDVLELEISGPKQPHLTLVDLPGIFHSTTSKQSEGDPALVTNIVKSYMKEERAIILAVISGKYDYAVQQILSMLKSADPEGYRTMGVITKPDAIEQASADEESFLSLATNSERPLRLGWHVLRNPSFTERRDATFNRDSTEAQFFANHAPWNTLPSSNVGVAALRPRLSQLLLDHITSELPTLINNMGGEIANCESILKTLGDERSEIKDQRFYLTIIGERFKQIAEDGVEGYYRHNYFTTAADQRLRAKVQKAHTAFATRMMKEGQRWSLVAEGKFMFGSPAKDLSPEGPPQTILRSTFIQKVCELREELRGRELPGNYNPFILRELFRRQSVLWKKLAYQHAHDVLDMVRVFVEDLIEHVAGKERAEILLKHMIDPAIAEIQDRMEAKVAELLTPYTDAYPLTLNPEFEAAITSLNKDDKATAETPNERQRMDLLESSRLVDCMECYYKIASVVFVDNIATLAIENCVLNKVTGLVSPGAVASMSDERVKILASESPDNIRTRKVTSEKKAALQKGLEKCRDHVRRMPRTPRPSKSPSNIGSSGAAGTGTLFKSSPSRPVTPPALSPASTVVGSDRMSGSRSEKGGHAIGHGPTTKPAFSMPDTFPNPPNPFLSPGSTTRAAISKGSPQITA